MTEDQQYVTFGIDREIFAIPVHSVEEILDLGSIAHLPRAPACLLGLMDVRGKSTPVMDLRLRLGLPAIERTSRTRVLIVDQPGHPQRTVGLVADCVFEVTGLAGADVATVPTIGARWTSDCIVGIGRRNDAVVIILKLEKLFGDGELLAESRAA